MGAFLFLLDRLGLLGRLDLVFLHGLLAFRLDRTELTVVRLLAPGHLLLDTLGDQAGTAPDVAKDALKILRTLLEGTEPGLQVLGAIVFDVLAHPVLAGDYCRRQLRNQFLPCVLRRAEGIPAQMTGQSAVRTGGVGALVERVCGEGLAVDELLTFRDDDVVIGRGVVGLVALTMWSLAGE